MVTMRVDVYGDTQLERRLVRFGDRSKDLAPMLPLLDARFIQIEMEQFESEGATGSRGWAPLKPATIRAKAARGSAVEILQATRKMFDAFTRRTDPDHIARYQASTFFLGADDPKAKFHQKGTRRMPVRKPVDLTETQRRELIKIAQGYMMADR